MEQGELSIPQPNYLESVRQTTAKSWEDIITSKRRAEIDYQNAINSLRYNQELSRPIIEEARRKRDQLLESTRGFLMTKEDFNRYFTSGNFAIHASLKQQNVGDCYLVAAIHAMSCSPYFEMICRSSIKRMPDSSWQVKIPLMSENGEIVTITPKEILPQRNKQFLKKRKGNRIIPDLRPQLKPLKGNTGLQVLEAAFIKAKFGTVDRIATTSGSSDEALIKLGGKNFIKDSVYSVQWNKTKNRWENLELGSLGTTGQASIDHFLEKFDPEIYIATAGTKPRIDKLTDLHRDKGTVKFLVPNHVYSITNVDKDKKIINLVNPWDTSKTINLTFDQFKNSFSDLEATRIDSRQILRNMERLFH